MDVLVTGANGPVGTAITDHLAGEERYSFTTLDRAEPEDPNPAVETVVADATDYDAIRPHFEGVDAVVDLVRAPFPEAEKAGGQAASWSDALAANLEATTTVFEAAADAGVDSVVYGSSNHVVGMYEYTLKPALYDPDYDLTVDHTVPVRPDSMYAVWKVFGEAVGRMVVEAGDLRCYALRICNVTGPDRETPADYAESLLADGTDPDSVEFETAVRRKQAMWHSRRDLAHLVDCCLRDDSVDFDVFYGVSDNAARWFDLDHAREVLGYDPVDDGNAWDVLD